MRVFVYPLTHRAVGGFCGQFKFSEPPSRPPHAKTKKSTSLLRPGPAMSPYAVLLCRPGVRTVGGSIDHDVIGKDIPTRLLDEGDVLISQADGITAIVVEAR